MSDSSPEINAEYSQIRELLLGSEKRELQGVSNRIGEIETIYKRIQSRLEELDESKQWMDRRVRTIEQGEDFINRNIVGALAKRNQSEKDREALVNALTQDVELCLSKSVKDDRVKVAETLAPAVELILESRKRSFSKTMAEKAKHSPLGRILGKNPWLGWVVPLILAIILAVVVAFSVVGNLRWTKALAELRGEPGIEVIDARNPFFGKASVSGLRDPKAKNPSAILESNKVNVGKTTIRFAEYHSLNTSFANERKLEEEARFTELRAEFIDRFGDMVEAVAKVRRDDLETMTKSVFQTRFPEAAATAEIYLEDDQWFLKGHLDEPLFSDVVRELPSLVLTGEVNVENLTNSSQTRLNEVRSEIAGLTFIFLSGSDELSEDGQRQQKRMTGLLKEHEKLVADLKVAGAKFEVHALPIVGNSEGNRKMEAMRIKTVEGILKSAGIKEDQILPGVHDEEAQEGRVGVYTIVVKGEEGAASAE